MGESRRLHLVALGLACLGACRTREPAPEPSVRRALDAGPVSRLGARLAARADYQVLVGVPVTAPTRWARAIRYTTTAITTDDGVIAVADVQAFLIAYPNDQLVDVELDDLDMPPDFDGLREGPPDPTATLDSEAAHRGLQRLSIEFAPSPAHPDAVDHYATTLRNLTAEPIRVTRFSAFVDDGGTHRISSVSGGYFSAEEFQQWYGAPADGWIGPGGRVTDPDNYGRPDVMWAYFAETRGGETFVAGKLLSASWRTPAR